MSADWNICTLNEIVDFGNGKARPKTEGNIPIYGGNGVLGYSDESNYQDETIIIGRVGAYCGATYYENNPIWISDNALSAKAKEGYLSKYAYYVLKSKNLNQYAQGSSHPLLTQGLLKTIEAHVTTNLDVQKKIVSIISGLEDKIELNRQTNQTLEHIAQALFKCWFVDFEPTRAKIIAKEKGANTAIQELAAQAIICGAMTLEQLEAITQNLETTLQQAINEKLNQANQTPINTEQLKTTAALFPNALVESELGEIPEGWFIKPLYETAEYINGAPFKAKDFSNDGSGLPIVKIAELKNGLGDNTKYTVGEFNRKYFIQDEDVLYSWSGSPLTSLEVFKWFGGSGWLNQHIFKLNFKNIEDKHYTYYLLQHMKPILIATAQQKQTTGLGHITVADMKRLLVVDPDKAVLKCFSETVGLLYEQCSYFSKENVTLTQLRDSLLPKLLSGELNVTSD